MTKAQRSARAKTRGRKTRKARAAKKLLQVMNPASAKHIKAVRIRRNKGGSVTIIPIRKVIAR